MDNYKTYVSRKIRETGKYFINRMTIKKSLLIINKQMEARVLFLYDKKNKTYFLSDIIDLKQKINHIDKSNRSEIEQISSIILEKFNDGLIQKSVLVEDINSVIDKYFTDSYIILMDRFYNEIEDDISFEVFNKIIVLTADKEVLEVNTFNNNIVYKKADFMINTNQPVNDTMDDLFSEVVLNSTYPITSNFLSYKKLKEDYFTDNPLIIFFTIIAEDIDYCKVVNFSKNANFGKKSIYLLSDILALADTDEMANDYDRDINKLVNTFNESLNLAA